MKKILWMMLACGALAGCASDKPLEKTAQPEAKPQEQAVVAPAPTTAAAPMDDVDTQAVAKADASKPQEQAAAAPVAVPASVQAEADAKKAAEAEGARRAAAEAAAIAQLQAKQAVAAKADPLNDSNGALGKRSTHFPFDVDRIQEEDKALVQAHGEYLESRPDRKVRIEGNADERGSTEYNLGLGQRRANNTKRALVLSGAEEGQIETMSYGEERPKCTQHEESCWWQNRRADIVYK